MVYTVRVQRPLLPGVARVARRNHRVLRQLLAAAHAGLADGQVARGAHALRLDAEIVSGFGSTIRRQRLGQGASGESKGRISRWVQPGERSLVDRQHLLVEEQLVRPNTHT